MKSLARVVLCSSLIAAGCAGPTSPPPSPASTAPAALGLAVPDASHGAAVIATEEPADPPPAPAPARDVRRPTDWRGDDSVPGVRRAEVATANRKEVVQSLFEEAGVSFPPAEVFFRVFKAEGELEAWASEKKGGAMTLIATYGICRASGELGPKRREGDLQVPEGFYRLEYFWPDSAFYLSAKVSYPNVLDKQLGGPAPGGEIMLHGGCASIGCISMSDERMEELWVMGTSVHYAGSPVAMHIFPTRDLHALIEASAASPHRAFWQNLAEGFDAFEDTHRLPTVVVGWKGRYDVTPASGS